MSRPSAAAGLLAAVRRQTSDEAIRLAYHAALPVVVDPGLLNLLRVNFFLDTRDPLAFEDEAALLLSPLFREIGDDLYEIDPETRNLLLIGLNTKYGMTRVRQVAFLLERYTQSMPSWSAQPELEQAQQLTALSFTDPERAQAWLRGAHAGRRPGILNREWFVAMERSLADQVLGVTAADEMADAVGRLELESLTERLEAIRSLAALAQLPDTDPEPIVTALAKFLRARFVTSMSPLEVADIQSAFSLIRTLPHPARLEAELLAEVPRVSADPAALLAALTAEAARDAAVSAAQSAQQTARPASRRRGSLAQSYSRLIREHLGYLPTWPIMMKIEVGDIGTLKEGIFTPERHASDINIPIRAITSPLEGNFIVSDLGVSAFPHFTIRVADEPYMAPAGRDGTISTPPGTEVRLWGEGTSLVHWTNTTQSFIDDMPRVATSVLDLESRGEWSHEWVMVTEVIHARNGVILISGAEESYAIFQTTQPADLPRGTEPGTLAALDDPSLRLSKNSGMALITVTNEEFTPCFRASRVRRRLLGTSQFAPVKV